MRAHIGRRGVLPTVAASAKWLIPRLVPKPYLTHLTAHSLPALDFVREGLSSSLPLGVAWRASRDGFTQRLYDLYELETRNDPKQYLSERQRVRAKLANEHAELLDDKMRFYSYLRGLSFEDHLPAVYGVIRNGRFASDAYADIGEALQDHGRLVIKKLSGGGGSDVYICTSTPAGPVLHGKNQARYPIAEVTDVFGTYLVSEFCQQASYMERIYAAATNTIRLITYRSETDEIRIPAAVHRIGSERTGMLDNFSQGGMSAWIDLDDGRLTAAAEPRRDGPPLWHETHPDSGEQIRGARVPGWPSIREGVRTIAGEARAFDYVGWDVVVTEPGSFKIIEGNSHPNPDVVQVHRPMLTDADLRAFYEARNLL